MKVLHDAEVLILLQCLHVFLNRSISVRIELAYFTSRDLSRVFRLKSTYSASSMSIYKITVPH